MKGIMGKGKTIAAIDIGTEKACTLIAQLVDGEREPSVVGVASVPSKGLRKSQIVDLDEAIEAITQSVDAAERMAGVGLKSAYISIVVLMLVAKLQRCGYSSQSSEK